MTTEFYFIAPDDISAAAVGPALAAALAHAPAAAVLLPRGQRSERDYKDLVKAGLPVAQKAGAAVLVEGEPGLVRMLGADGLHVTGGIDAVAAALDSLKPDYIVGVGQVTSRDDAMVLGEAGIDYILFGPLSGSISAAERDLAQWWSETMEIPSVLADPAATTESFDASGCEFIGLTLAKAEVGA